MRGPQARVKTNRPLLIHKGGQRRGLTAQLEMVSRLHERAVSAKSRLGE